MARCGARHRNSLANRARVNGSHPVWEEPRSCGTGGGEEILFVGGLDYTKAVEFIKEEFHKLNQKPQSKQARGHAAL